MATLEPSRIFRQSILSPEDSRVRTSLTPGNGPGSRELAAGFGLSSPVWFGNLDLDGCSLRTSQASLFSMQCDELSENWPDSGMWGSGEVYELRNSEPVTSVNECSLWPMPQRHDSVGGKTQEQIAEMRERTGAGVSNLNETAEHWETPNAHDGRRPGSDDTSTQGRNLKREAENWPTASARDWKSGQASEETFHGNARPLNEWAERFPLSHQDLVTPDGQQSSPSDRTSRRRLNPRFVEWLMGFPVTWTEL
jgi:hypothetical protein